MKRIIKEKGNQTGRNNFFRKSSFFKTVIWTILIAFTSETFGVHSAAYAQSYLQSLPVPGTMVSLSAAYAPMLMKGIKTYPDNPFRFDFFIDPGQEGKKPEEVSKESEKLIKYFLASLTVPEEQLWVNLSPYEKDRIMPSAFGITEMGRDLLAQDYFLKQISASLLDPSTPRGEEFWKKIYSKIRQLGGNAGAINTFNKVWIIPETAEVYTKNGNAFVVSSHLKVMLEEDYVAGRLENSGVAPAEKNQYSPVVREVIVPAIEKEVNEGENFAMLRQIYNSMILATWFKRHLRESLFSQIYVGQNKVGGVDVDDKDIKEKIYQQYLAAFKKGVFDFIREDYDAATDETTPRKYFAGGINFNLTNFAVMGSSAVASPYHETSDDMSLRRLNIPTTNIMGQPFLNVSAVVVNPKGVDWYRRMTTARGDNFLLAASSSVDSFRETALGTKVAGLFRKSFLKASGVLLSTLLLFSLSGFSNHAEAAKINYDADRGAIIQVERGDTLSDILATVNIHQQEIQPGFNGLISKSFFGKDGGKERVIDTIAQAMNISNADKLIAGHTYVIPEGFLAGEYKAPPAQVVTVVGKKATVVEEPAQVVTVVGKKVALPTSQVSVRNDQPSFLSDESRYPLSIALIENKSVNPSLSPTTVRIPSFSGEISPRVKWTIALLLSVLMMVKTAQIIPFPSRGKRRPSVDPVVDHAVSAATKDYRVVASAPNLPSSKEAELAAKIESTTKALMADQGLSRQAAYQKARDLVLAEEKSGVASVRPSGVTPPSEAEFRTVLPPQIEETRDEVLLGQTAPQRDFGSLNKAYTPPSRKEAEAYKAWQAANSRNGQSGVSSAKPNPSSSGKSRSGFWSSFFKGLAIVTGFAVLAAAMGGDAVTTGISLACGNGGLAFLKENETSFAKMMRSGFSKIGISILNFAKYGREKLFFPKVVTVLLEKVAAVPLWISSYFLVKILFPQWVRTSLEKQLEILTLRGGESVGIATFAYDAVNKLNVVIAAKYLKDKRGGGLWKGVEKEFIRQIHIAGQKGMVPLEGEMSNVWLHVRLPTGGLSTLYAAHPFDTAGNIGSELYNMFRGEKGHFAIQGLWSLQGGQLAVKTDNAIVSIGANGDNNKLNMSGQTLHTKQIRDFYAERFQHKLGEAYQWDTQRGEDGQLPSKHRIVNGDSPPIALDILYRLNQGNSESSWWYALDHVVYGNNSEEIMANVMTPQEDAPIIGLINDTMAAHAKAVSRPTWAAEAPNKTWGDLWMTEEMAADHPQGQFQLDALNALREDLKNRLKNFCQNQETAVAPGSATGHMIAKLKGDDVLLEQLVNMIVERFFTADQKVALREFADETIVAFAEDENSEDGSTYGLQVKYSETPNEISLLSWKQGLSIGYQKKNGFLTWSSEGGSMVIDYAGKGMLDKIIDLDNKGGQIAHIAFYGNTDTDGPLFDLSVYSIKEKRELSHQEIEDQEDDLVDRQPVVYQNPQNKTGEDFARTPREVHRLLGEWDDPQSHNRQSADAKFEKYVSRDLEHYLKDNSKFYHSMQGSVMGMLGHIIDNAIDTSTAEGRMKKARVLHDVQNDSLIPYLRDYLDRRFARKADELAARIMAGEITEDDLPEEQTAADAMFRQQFYAELKRVGELIANREFQFFQDWLTAAKAKGGELGVITSGEFDSLEVGYESSDHLGQSRRDMEQDLFPQKKSLTVSSNAGVGLNGFHGIGYRTIATVTTKSGATSPSANSVERLLDIMPGNVFVATGAFATLAGRAVGQKYRKNSKFSRRIFYTGAYYPTEAVTIGDFLQYVNDLSLTIYLAKRFRQLYPHRQPFGMQYTAEEIAQLEEYQRTLLVAEAERMVGVNKDGVKKENAVHEKINKDAHSFGKSIRETPVGNLAFRTFVFGSYMLALPVQSLYSYFTGTPPIPSGLDLILGGDNIPMAAKFLDFGLKAIDFSIAVTFQWLFTAKVYRAFSGRLTWARLGSLTMMIEDPSLLVGMGVKMIGIKEGSMAPGSMAVTYHRSDPTDNTAAEDFPRTVRGTYAIYGLPHDIQDVDLTARQHSAIQNGILGQHMKAGVEIFMFFRGQDDSAVPAGVRHKINLGIPEGLDEASPRVQAFYRHFDIWGRWIAEKYFIDEAYRYATSITVLGQVRQLYDRAATFFKTGVLSTRIPRGLGKKVKIVDSEQDPFANFPALERKPHVPKVLKRVEVPEQKQSQGESPSDSQQSASSALSAAPGGIDLNPRSLKINITGDPSSSSVILPAPEILLDPKILNAMPSDRFVPLIIEMVPVASVDMFLSMAARENTAVASLTP